MTLIKDNKRLNEATSIYMKNKGYFESKSIKADDGGWWCNKKEIYYLIEEKTERESIGPHSNWWKNEKDDLLGKRNEINKIYQITKTDKHRIKWMIVIAQLRSDLNELLKNNKVSIKYRAIFSIPSNEIKNFEIGYKKYCETFKNQFINGDLNIWKPGYCYLDQRGIEIKVNIIEITRDNFFNLDK